VQGGDVGGGVEFGFEVEVVEGELADGFGVDLEQPPEVFVVSAEPLDDLVGVLAGGAG
jgi:hypothetical protein